MRTEIIAAIIVGVSGIIAAVLGAILRREGVIRRSQGGQRFNAEKERRSTPKATRSLSSFLCPEVIIPIVIVTLFIGYMFCVAAPEQIELWSKLRGSWIGENDPDIKITFMKGGSVVVGYKGEEQLTTCSTMLGFPGEGIWIGQTFFAVSFPSDGQLILMEKPTDHGRQNKSPRIELDIQGRYRRSSD